MPLTHSDVRRILEVLDSAENLESLSVTLGEFQLHAHKPGAGNVVSELAPRSQVQALVSASSPAIALPPIPAGVPVLQTSAEVPEGLVAVRAPMVGTFYLRPSPDQPPFIGVGDVVQDDDTVCLVEVMKMFNTVKAGVAGTIEKILARDGKPVNHDEILMLIRPLDASCA